MSDIYKNELEMGKRFSNDAGEAETRDVYAKMLESERLSAEENAKQIKEKLSESKSATFKEIHAGLLDAILSMKKFTIENNLQNEDVDKCLCEAEKLYTDAAEIIAESVIKG